MENIRRVNPLQTGAVNPMPSVRPGENEPLVPIASDGVELHGVSSSPIEARPVLVPLTLAQHLVQLPNAGLRVAANASGPSGLGLAAAPASPAELSSSTLPAVRVSPQVQADKAVADVVRGSRPETASVKTALFQVLRKKQPGLTPDAIHAANQFIEASRTPQEMGVRLLSLVKLYGEQPTLDASHLNAIQSYTDAAPSPEEAMVRLWGLANMLKGGPEVAPDKIHAMSASLEEITGLVGRDNALEHLARGGKQLSAAGVQPFLSTITDGEGDGEVRRDAAYHIAHHTPGAFG